MTSSDRIEQIFQDARELQADALEMLAQGRIRNAAEKAWGRRSGPQEALVLARRPARMTNKSAWLVESDNV